MDDKASPDPGVFGEAVGRLLAEGRLPEALALADARLEGAPDDPEARLALCRIRIAQGALDEAREMLVPLEAALENLKPLYLCRGDLLRAEGALEAAEACYRTLLQIDPPSRLAAEATARLEALAVRTTADVASEADGEVPADFQTVTLAELYVRQGHLELAEEMLAAILQRDPRHAEAAQRLQEVRERQRRAATERRMGPLLGELNRWLTNLGRLRSHAD